MVQHACEGTVPLHKYTYIHTFLTHTHYLFLCLCFLFPGGIDGIHHPFYCEVGDGPKYGEAEEQADDLIASQGASDALTGNLLKNHLSTMALGDTKHIVLCTSNTQSLLTRTIIVYDAIAGVDLMNAF